MGTQEAHVPVLLAPLLEHAAPVTGVWVDGTFGAGGYSRALLAAGAAQVIGIDRDPEVFRRAEVWRSGYSDNLVLVPGNFAQLDKHLHAVGHEFADGVVLDIGVSSMQLDQPGRGFSFLRDGPLDMRMSQDGPTAADIVNDSSEAALADILFQYGEERASRRIAKAIVAARKEGRIETTGRLAEIIAGCLPKARKGQPHPATRGFQALRIAVNDELGALARGLFAAEEALRPGGILAVVTFHSLEDRVVKRFLAARSGGAVGGSRHRPAADSVPSTFEKLTRKAIAPTEEEVARNPRARSAKLRMARRTHAAPGRRDLSGLGLPRLDLLKEVSE